MGGGPVCGNWRCKSDLWKQERSAEMPPQMLELMLNHARLQGRTDERDNQDMKTQEERYLAAKRKREECELNAARQMEDEEKQKLNEMKQAKFGSK